MAAPRALYIGPRLRRVRRELGLTQQQMAEDLGISPSYVALLERNQRPVTADMLLRLARTYRLDVTDLAAGDGEGYARRVAELLRDPIFADIDLPPLEVADLATSFPGVTEALLRLYGAYTREQQALAQSRTGQGGTPDALDEARAFLNDRRNVFAELDDAAEALAGRIDAAGGAEAWLAAAGTRVRVLPAGVMADTLRRHDRHNAQLLIADTLEAPKRAFQVAVHIACTALRREVAAAASGSFASPTAAALVRRAVASHAAAALRMPHARFARAAEARRYDIDALARDFAVTFEQAAHRLVALARPGGERVPFFLLRVDEAGNVSKRLDATGLPFARQGGGCPLWTLHAAAGTPGETWTQWLELPDGQRFFSVARGLAADMPPAEATPARRRRHHALAIACAAEHAPRLAYADAALAAAGDARGVAATPIGTTCRLCHRPDCTARAAPPVGREVLPDDNRRALAPFVFDEN